MFKSASFFRIATDFVLPPLEALEEALQSAQFMPCGATQPESVVTRRMESPTRLRR